MLVEHPRQSKLTEELIVSHSGNAFYVLKPIGRGSRFHIRDSMAIEFSSIIIQVGEYFQTSYAVFQVCLLHARKIVSEAILGTKGSTQAFTL